MLLNSLIEKVRLFLFNFVGDRPIWTEMPPVQGSFSPHRSEYIVLVNFKMEILFSKSKSDRHQIWLVEMRLTSAV